MERNDHGTMPSRRDLMSAGAALAAAAATAGPAFAQAAGEARTASQSEPGRADGRLALTNPRQEFPRPPFPKQEQPDGAEVVELIRSAGRKAVELPGDIRDEQFCQKLVADAVQGMGGLDLVVNVAGRQQSVPAIEELTTGQFDWTVKTNLYAMFWIIKAAVPHLPPGSSIINTTSIQAFDPSGNLLDYAMTKGGISTFTMALAKQLAPKGIRVNGVAPGPFWTPLQITGGQPPEAIPQFGAQTPMGRAGQPVEIAPTYVMLASAAASYTTGEIVGATGGKPLS